MILDGVSYRGYFFMKTFLTFLTCQKYKDKTNDKANNTQATPRLTSQKFEIKIPTDVPNNKPEKAYQVKFASHPSIFILI